MSADGDGGHRGPVWRGWVGGWWVSTEAGDQVRMLTRSEWRLVARAALVTAAVAVLVVAGVLWWTAP